MRRKGKAIELATIGFTLIWATVSAGCNTAIRTHPPTQTRIERMQEQLRQMETPPTPERSEVKPPGGE